MTDRMTSSERRKQVAEVALTLLGEVSLSQLTTRLIAKRTGISQPGLFRHFRSRDEILTEVVSLVRSSLVDLGASVLKELDPLLALRGITQGLFAYSVEHPGFSRLLFFDASDDELASFHAPLHSLVASQKALVTQIIVLGQQRKRLCAEIAPERAAILYVSLLQGTLLQWQHGGRCLDLEAVQEDLLELFGAALSKGLPARRVADSAPSSEAKAVLLDCLDVRSLLSEGKDPLEEILARISTLLSGGLLELIAPFRPAPLLGLLEERGHPTVVEEMPEGLWRVWIRRDTSARLHDFRDLPAPEPLQGVLEKCAELPQGQGLLALVPKHPRMLFPQLEKRGLEFVVRETFDQAAILSVRNVG